MATPLDQAPQWVHDLLPAAEKEAAADAEQAALLERVRVGDPDAVASFEELGRRLGLDLDPAADREDLPAADGPRGRADQTR
jgi:hypothetical protein